VARAVLVVRCVRHEANYIKSDRFVFHNSAGHVRMRGTSCTCLSQCLGTCPGTAVANLTELGVTNVRKALGQEWSCLCQAARSLRRRFGLRKSADD
jgi:hypothetical protein